MEFGYMTQNKYLILVLAVLIIFSFNLQKLHGKEFVIGHKKTVLRSGPGFISKPVGELKYRDKFRIITSKGDWVKITSAKKSGWIHKTAAWPKKTVMNYIGRSKDGKSNSFKRDVVVAAGMGVSEGSNDLDIKNKKDMKAVSQLEKYKIDTGQIAKFSTEGMLPSKLFGSKNGNR